MDVTSIVGITGGLVAGLASSLHCAVMCGPLACAALPWEGRRSISLLSYQLSRIAAYSLVGALLGAMGGGVLLIAASRVEPYFPWIMVAALLATAFDVARRVAPLPGIRRIAPAMTRLGAKLSPPWRAASIGFATPFLPCGLLYGLMLAAIASGGPGRGALVMGGFAVGGVPALAFAQLQTRWFGRSRWSSRVQRALPVLAAVAIVWRTLMVGPPVMANPVIEQPTSDVGAKSPVPSEPSIHHCH